MEDKELRRSARERVEFKRHLLVYVIVIALLGIINLLTSRQFLWFLFPAGGWGIGIIFHFFSAYGRGELSVEKEYQKLKQKERRKQSP
jgi:hypothetical protein